MLHLEFLNLFFPPEAFWFNILFQFEAAEKRNALVVDLYKENADLMDKLYKVETQKKDAVSRCYKLEDQCNHLRRMLKKMATVAVR